MDSFRFISTKLKMPMPRRNYIKRGHLFNKLDEVLSYKVTLVKGAAGSGKTTLVTSFIKENEISEIKWITLDKDNNNSFSFWYYFIEAAKDYLGSERDEIASAFRNVLQKEEIDGLIPILINQLDFNKDIILVLDDFHLINDAHLKETIEFFIKYSSDNVHLIILTREEPSLYLSDLAMDGRLMTINEGELCFTSNEGMDFLKNTLNLNMKEEELAEINSVSEGWIGGLQLIALASGTTGPGFFKKVRTLDRQIVEYLSREILDSLDEDLKDFLLKTSILGYFDENICNKFLGISKSNIIISEILEKNLFIIGIGDDNQVYRYHNIFGEFLRIQYSKFDDTFKKGMHKKAAEIFKGLGDVDESIRQLLEAELYKEALPIILKIEQTLKSWAYLSQLPLEYIVQDRDIAFQRYFFHFCNFEWEKCRTLYEALKGKYSDKGTIKLFEFANAIINDDFPDMDVLSIEEIDSMRLSNVARAIIFIKTAILLGIQGRFNDALEFVNKATAIEEQINNPYMKIFLLSISSSQIKEEMGDLKECEALYQEAFKMIERYKFLQSLKLNCYVGITGKFLKCMELEKAVNSLSMAWDLLDGRYASMERGYYHNLMELKLLLDEKKDAEELIKKLFTYDVYTSNFLHATDLIKGMLYLGIIDMTTLDKFTNIYDESTEPYKRIEDRILYSRILYMKGKKEAAVSLIDEVLQYSRKEKVKFRLVEGILTKISFLSENVNGNKREIFNLLREAIFYSYENRIMSPYVMEQKIVAGLLEKYQMERSNDLNPEEKFFLKDLLKMLNSKTEKEELLSEREKEVLKELSTGASNKEIGSRLCISVSTVKTHIINIYSKLMVSNRVEAIDKAKTEGII